MEILYKIHSFFMIIAMIFWYRVKLKEQVFSVIKKYENF